MNYLGFLFLIPQFIIAILTVQFAARKPILSAKLMAIGSVLSLLNSLLMQYLIFQGLFSDNLYSGYAFTSIRYILAFGGEILFVIGLAKLFNEFHRTNKSSLPNDVIDYNIGGK